MCNCHGVQLANGPSLTCFVTLLDNENKEGSISTMPRADDDDDGGSGGGDDDGGGGTFRVSFLISAEDNAPDDARIK